MPCLDISGCFGSSKPSGAQQTTAGAFTRRVRGKPLRLPLAEVKKEILLNRARHGPTDYRAIRALINISQQILLERLRPLNVWNLTPVREVGVARLEDHA